MDEIIKIDLKTEGRSVIKTGMSVRALFFLLMALGTLAMAINFYKSPTALYVLLIITIILISVFLKVLNSVFYKESVILTSKTISILHKTLVSTKKYDFDIDDIIYLGFSEQQYTKHAMDNPVIDFTGLASGERELQYIIDEGNIRLETAGKAIKFGKNMPFWDVEEVLEKIEAVTRRKFGRPENAFEKDENDG